MHETNLLEDQPIAWTPTPDVIESAQVTGFMRQVGVTTWDELYEFSIRDVEKFTEEVLKFLDIKFDPPYARLLDVSDGIEFPHWFTRTDRGEKSAFRNPQSQIERPEAVATGPTDLGSGISDLGFGNAESDTETQGAESVRRAVATGSPAAESTTRSHAGLNITTMCLDRWQTDEMKDQPAVIWEGETGEPQIITYKGLHGWVGIFSAALKANGIRPGDAVGIHLPMIWETVVALLAINRIGAIAVPVFSGYGVDAVASRLSAVRAKALFTCGGFRRRGKWVNALSVAAEAVTRSSSVKTMFVMDVSGDQPAEYLETYDRVTADFAQKGVAYIGEAAFWFYGTPDGATEQEYLSKTAPVQTSAEDPLIILYTSGTTGKPKGIAHTHASFPIKAAQDMAFGTDVGRGTRICWYTDIGWMMGPWLIYGALINGATICIYDGAPDYPTPDRMWEFCAKHKVEVLGISPTLVRALAAHEESGPPPAGTRPVQRVPSASVRHGASEDGFTQRREDAKQAPFERHDLSNLRIFASTGEPWNPAPWWWLFENVGNSKLPIINYSGGTEIAGGILMGSPLLPIKPCSFPAPCPGMDVDILDEEGKPVGPNQVGELVIKQPWIGMARGFWQEEERYLDTYWRRFPNIWVHGDWAMRDKDDHWFILGRSDDTLKVAGKRVGPAEVESLLVAHPLVAEAAVIGVPDEVKGTAMVAFCVLSASSHNSAPSGTTEKKENPEHTEKMECLKAELRALVAKDMGKPLAPSKIHFVSALPKTRNAKVMRRVLRSAYLGEDPGDLSALENPSTVEEIGKSRSETSA